MPTQIIRLSEGDAYDATLAPAAAALRDGALVVFPTETVYGVAANAAADHALDRLCRLKNRRDNHAFTIHVARPRDAGDYVTAPGSVARRLMRKAWPGPLTLVLDEPRFEQTLAGRRITPQRRDIVLQDGAVGLRCPDHPAATALLSAAEAPIVASSANRAGQPPPHELAAALEAVGEDVDFAIDAGRTRFGAASTVVAVRNDEWRVLRQGALDARTIARLARTHVLFVCTGNSCRSPMAEYMFRRALSQRLGLAPEKLARAGYVVSSAGTAAAPRTPASRGAIEELSRRGIDAAMHLAAPLTLDVIHAAERIYCMTDEHRAAVLALAPGAAGRTERLDPDGPISDPIGGGPEAYRRAAEQIERAIERRVEELVDEDRDW